jgi:hypothetical protein
MIPAIFTARIIHLPARASRPGRLSAFGINAPTQGGVKASQAADQARINVHQKRVGLLAFFHSSGGDDRQASLL